MRFGVLGPIAAWTDDGGTVPIQGAKVRALLADLVVHLGQPVAGDRLVDDLWGESPDSTNPAGLLSSKVSQLRRALDAAEPGARALVVSPPPGYTLAVEATAVDAGEFAALVDEAGRPRRRTRRGRSPCSNGHSPCGEDPPTARSPTSSSPAVPSPSSTSAA